MIITDLLQKQGINSVFYGDILNFESINKSLIGKKIPLEHDTFCCLEIIDGDPSSINWKIIKNDYVVTLKKNCINHIQLLLTNKTPTDTWEREFLSKSNAKNRKLHLANVQKCMSIIRKKNAFIRKIRNASTAKQIALTMEEVRCDCWHDEVQNIKLTLKANRKR